MFRTTHAFCLTALLFTAAYAPAQDGAPQVPLGRPAQQQAPANGGSVTGRVLCGDTQRPARFAQVTLIPAEEASNPTGREQFGRRASARTDLDGTFTATNVAPGDYYVSAYATGYVSQGALMVAAGMDTNAAMARLSQVHVSANASSTVNVSLERGGVIAGRAQWDDGSPAAGVQINAISTTPPAQTGGNGNRGGFGIFGGLGEGGQTDDRGQFRITGLAPGDYMVRTVIQAPTPGPANGPGGGAFGRVTAITMYAPGKIRRSDAQTVTVRSGEERSDLVIMLDLSTLHRVSGRVGAASGTVGSGTVRLVDTTDSSVSRSATIASDGSYQLTYVPAGTYTLSVPFASSASAQDNNGGRGGNRGRASSSFQPFSETVSVTGTDLSGVDVTLTPATTAATGPTTSATPE